MIFGEVPFKGALTYLIKGAMGIVGIPCIVGIVGMGGMGGMSGIGGIGKPIGIGGLNSAAKGDKRVCFFGVGVLALRSSLLLCFRFLEDSTIYPSEWRRCKEALRKRGGTWFPSNLALSR